ncbi:IS3 family transposase [Streptosporangium lutulentum]|uniref:IS3 family transposase n=1 Tax=Streptosporangium lutulentum TaxID=1461250 RepID=UPI0027D9053B|nr:IS3 family transposase [Streptosporangium lutulentum]
MEASKLDPQIPDPQVRERAAVRRYTAAYKARILAEYDQLDKAGKGALMRREGLYSSLISSWKTARDHGASEALARPVGRPKADPRDKKIDTLEGEVERLRAELDKTRQVIEVQGKALRAAGSVRHRQRGTDGPGRAVTEIIETAQAEAIEELTPLLGRRNACAAAGVPQANWYRKNRTSPAPDRPSIPRTPHPAALSHGERERIRTVLNERFADAAPATAYFTLLDEGTYLASESTMYRILREHGEVGRDRRRQATHPAKTIPELFADAPNRVWAWDITKLRGPHKGIWYHLYTIIDIYSRCVVGWMVASRESAALAKRLIAQTIIKQKVNRDALTLHADRGSSMKSKTVAELLIDLGVAKSHSRPKTSNDNPHIEASFKTLKYCPAFPGRFGSIEDARAFCQDFYTWYNQEHYHSGIGYHHPADAHYGRAAAVRDRRAHVLATAQAAHPERFASGGAPTPPNLPGPAWINKPKQDQTDEQKDTPEKPTQN